MRSRKQTCIGACLWIALATVAVAEPPSPDAGGRQGYPTSVLADYVIGCLLANGTNPETLQKCSCSIDFIAESIPYDEYVRVETLMRLQQLEGVGRNAVYKSSAWSNAAVTRFKEIQAESTLRCF